MLKKEKSKLENNPIAGQIINIWDSSLFHLLLFLTLTSILFLPTIKSLIDFWYGYPQYSHGFLIPVIVAFLIWRKKEEIKPLVSDQRHISVLMISIIGLFFYLIGRLSLVVILYRMGFIIFLIGSVVFLIGIKAAKKISFPMAYSLFMIPLPITLYDYLTFPMKKMATYLSVQIISLLSITVYREGNVIHMPETTLEVVSACSGLNSLISILALGTICGYFSLNENLKRTIFVFLLIPIAIAANVIRITSTALISNYYTAEVTQGLLHEFTGTLLVLVIAFALMALTIRLLK